MVAPLSFGIQLHEDKVEGIPVEIVRRVYRTVAQFPTSKGLFGDLPFPHFEQLYEEFVAVIVEQQTNLSVQNINERLVELRDFKGKWDVEEGFRPHEFGINKETEFFNALLYYQLSFVLDRIVYNEPVKEVW